MTDTRTTFSALLHEPANILANVEQGDVVLERHDGSNLMLTTEQRAQAAGQATRISVAVLGRLAAGHPDIAGACLEETMAWMAWLPADERAVCTAELIADLSAGAAAGGDFTGFQQNLMAWHNTARIWSDPELAERLQTGFDGDGTPVTRPRRTPRTH